MAVTNGSSRSAKVGPSIRRSPGTSAPHRSKSRTPPGEQAGNTDHQSTLWRTLPSAELLSPRRREPNSVVPYNEVELLFLALYAPRMPFENLYGMLPDKVRAIALYLYASIPWANAMSALLACSVFGRKVRQTVFTNEVKLIYTFIRRRDVSELAAFYKLPKFDLVSLKTLEENYERYSQCLHPDFLTALADLRVEPPPESSRSRANVTRSPSPWQPMIGRTI